MSFCTWIDRLHWDLGPRLRLGPHCPRGGASRHAAREGGPPGQGIARRRLGTRDMRSAGDESVEGPAGIGRAWLAESTLRGGLACLLGAMGTFGLDSSGM